MKTITTVCNVIFGGLMLVTSHWVIAQVENVKLIEEERLVSAPPSAGQFADEQVIRALVERQNRGEEVIKGTDEFLLASGVTAAYPVVGYQPSTGTLEVPERVRLEQPAPAMYERIVRLVVAQSGELAYEYGDYAFGLAAPEPKAQSFDGSYLRVWRKQNGHWLVDAAFARP